MIDLSNFFSGKYVPGNSEGGSKCPVSGKSGESETCPGQKSDSDSDVSPKATKRKVKKAD